MNPYETLGVAREADMATIKKAYRRAAKGAHPDRNGGDTRAMVAVNVAYDILSDPARRERYDLGGEDIPPTPPLELRARMQLAQVFMELAQQPQRINIPKAAHRRLQENRRKLNGELSELTQLQGRLKSRLTDVTCTAQVNVFADQLTAALGMLQSQYTTRTEQIEAIDRAVELLKDYSSSVSEPSASVGFAVWTHYGVGTGG